MQNRFRLPIVLAVLLGCSSCNDQGVWNTPFDESGRENTLYSAFMSRPKHLDPALSYSSDEWVFINQIYEPPLQYHYLKRPYTLIPQTATQMPVVKFLDAQGQELPHDAPADKVAKSIYEIDIKPGIRYQNHPAFAQDSKGQYIYHQIPAKEAAKKHTINDFDKTGTREATAEDYVYQIKRLADPALNSPIFGLMSNYIEGLESLGKDIKAQRQKMPAKDQFVDMRSMPLSGVKTLSTYRYQITINGKYPQFLFWLAMPFFAPVPWEVDKFYSQPDLARQNISLDWFPVGTGPFVLSENNPNARMVLTKNPNFHGEAYPSEGEAGDEAQGLLKLHGQPLPMLDKINFILERESIPYWNKFLQGYYDQSNVTSDNFDQAVRASIGGDLEISEELGQKGIRMSTSVQPTDMYWGFNMLDPMVGGLTEEKRKLRQAISIAMDIEEYINIFLNGNAMAAQSLIPPGIFGHVDGQQGINTQVYNIDAQGKPVRKSIAEAKRLLAEAGFPNGMDPKTNQPLVLNFDAVVTGSPESQAEMIWLRKQFKKLNIELMIRPTQYNRFQDKVRNGDVQIFYWGWNADYPDPENFLFLLYSKNSRVKHGGENTTNYSNPRFDALYEQVKSMDNTPERAQLIAEMLKMAQVDSPWVFGFHPQLYTLRQGWVAPFKANAMSRNTLKYMSLDPKVRAVKRIEWNQYQVWPLILGLIVLMLLCVPAVIRFYRKQYEPLKLRPTESMEENKP